jgi:hypothetical protein
MSEKSIWKTSPEAQESTIDDNATDGRGPGAEAKGAGTQLIQQLSVIDKNTDEIRTIQRQTIQQIQDFKAQVDERLNKIQDQMRKEHVRLDKVCETLGKVYDDMQLQIVSRKWTKAAISLLCATVIVLVCIKLFIP